MLDGGKSNKLFHKTGWSISRIALEFLSIEEGERIPPIMSFEKKLDVSRGTVQNAIMHLIDEGAVELSRRGKNGSFLIKKDIKKLQELCMVEKFVGIMPLPYSAAYRALATALFECMTTVEFNMLYSRGSKARISFIERGISQFAIVSKYTADVAKKAGKNIKYIMGFGPGSYLQKHVLVFSDYSKKELEKGMTIAIDPMSIDQESLTEKLVKKYSIKTVITKSQSIMDALIKRKIDAAVWNLDDIIENYKDMSLSIVDLPDDVYSEDYTNAVMIVRADETEIGKILLKLVDKNHIMAIIKDVLEGEIECNY